MWSVHQKTHNRLILFLLLILISNSCPTINASETVITRKTEEINIPDPSIKCDTCPCDTCPEPVTPPPPPPALPPECPPPPPPPPPPCPPPPSPSPPPPKEPCDPCMAHWPPPPPRFYYTPNTPNLYVTEYNYSGGSQVQNGVVGIVVLVGVALLQLINIWV